MKPQETNHWRNWFDSDESYLAFLDMFHRGDPIAWGMIVQAEKWEALGHEVEIKVE